MVAHDDKVVLGFLGHPMASNCTLKGYRVGRATSLVEVGYNLGEIIAVGEWISTAFVRSCIADELMVPTMLNVAIDHDED